MVIKLDIKDKKILTLLDENARLSNSQIAKKVGLSKPAVEYRLKRFEKNDVIFQYYTIVDFTRLGYSQYKLYFKFQDTSLEEEQKIIDYWNKNKNVVWIVQIRGRWDLGVTIFARSNFDFGNILSKFMNQHAKFILVKDVLLVEHSSIYAREYLSDTKQSEFLYGIPSKAYPLDAVDHNILRVLSKNARINIVDLAKRLKLSRDVVNYRMKKLKKEGVIIQYRCYLNLQNIGINYYKIIFRTKNFDGSSEKAIISYVTKHKKATQYLKLIGSWDFEIEFETEDEDELYSILNDIRKRFSDIIREYDMIRITETYKYDFFPF